MKQRILYREVAYILGLVIMAVGSAMMEHANLGLSMVVAPAYLLSEILSISFGLAEDLCQALLLILMCLILRRFRWHYLWSFVTSVLFGLLLDESIWLFHFIPMTMPWRIALFTVGMLMVSAGIAFFCRTYIAPEVFELFVEKIAHEFHWSFHKCKTIFDCASCLLSIILSFSFFGFGNFVGIGWGTVVFALLNGSLILLFEKLYDRIWRYEDKFPRLREKMPH